MKKKVVIHLSYFFIVFGITSLNAQDALYYIHQKSGTEDILQQYIKQMIKKDETNIDTTNDLYINFIPPMACPRCEGVVIQYNYMLDKLLQNEEFIINVLLYKKEKALSQYIHQQNFRGNNLYVDTTDMFVNIFHVNNESAKVPYLTKISLQEGRLIWGLPTLGIDLNEALVEQVIEKKSLEALYNENKNNSSQKDEMISLRFQIDEWDWQRFCNLLMPIYPVDSFKIVNSDTLPIITKFAVNRQGDRLVIDNFINNSFFLFSLKGREWNAPIVLSPTPNEEKMYIDSNINSFIYQYCKENNILVSMYLAANFCDTALYVMASLPKLVMEIKDSVADLGYYNAPVCLIKNYAGILVNYDFFGDGNKINVTSEGYTFLHSQGVYFSEDSLFVFPLQKGWPAVGTSASPESDNTPFSEEFYDQANTLLFYCTKTGISTLTAPLDLLYKDYKLGYYYCSPLIKKYAQHYYWTDRKTGKICQLSNDFKTSTFVCDLLNIDTILQQQTFSETLAYMDSYIPYFNKTVVDFAVFENNECKAIICDGTNYYLYQEKNKVVNHISIFPPKIGNLNLTGMQFGYNQQKVLIIYGLYQNNQEIITYLFDIP